MTYDDQLGRFQEQQRLQQEEEQRRIEEERKRQEERRRQMQAQQQGPAGGIDPSTAMQMYSNFSGGSPAAGGISPAGTAGAGEAGAGTGASSASSGFSMWPVAVAAAVIAHNQWAKKKGLHDNVDAIDGRALYKDSEYYQEKGNEKVGGMGDEMRLAAMGSSPADLFRKDTWVTAAKLAAHGGILGNALKKIF